MTSLEPKLLTVAAKTAHALEFYGVELGSATSYRKSHRASRHETGFAAVGETCGACRWTDIAIFQRHLTSPDVGETDYVVYAAGYSVVAGETTRFQVWTTRSAFEILEFLTVRPSRDEPFMPPVYARALAQAAALDAGIRDAYINRAVV